MSSICIFGVFVADLCFFGKSIPARGQTILGSKHIVGPGGKGSNQAIAAARLNGSTYGQFINGLTKAGIEIDRKVLAELAISDAVSFQKLVEKAQASLK